jgi:hypothetical protein
MPYGMPERLTWPPSPLWVVPLCIAALLIAVAIRLT